MADSLVFSSPDERAEWFFAQGEEKVGPLFRSELESRWRSRELDEETLVWRPGMNDWQPLAEVQELVYLLVGVPQAALTPQPRPSPIAPVRLESLSSLVAWEINSAEKQTDDVMRRSELASLGLPAELATSGQPWGVAQPVPVEMRPSLSWTWKAPVRRQKRVRIAFLVALFAAANLLVASEIARRVGNAPVPVATVISTQVSASAITAPQQPAPLAASAPRVASPARVAARRSVAPPSEDPTPARAARQPLSRAAIVDAVKEQAPQLSSCLKEARASAEITAGRHPFVLNWAIEADGEVSAAKLSGPSYALDTSLPPCFAKVMRGWKFPASPKRNVVHNFPLPVRVP